MPLACPGRLICARLPKRTRRTVAANFLEEELFGNLFPSRRLGCRQCCTAGRRMSSAQTQTFALGVHVLVIMWSGTRRWLQRNSSVCSLSSSRSRDVQYLQHPSWLLLHLNMVSRSSRLADWRQFSAPSHPRLKKRLRSGQAPYSTYVTLGHLDPQPAL
ncbi:hypothetical protein HDK90DRAFT_231536 [Phyllosticta capitalensis]|uniref:Uncharacterized protein n=1 Tax=Phyllosticta capitalensis TaxID=121624 RepID=A0ABR1YUD4_9PEZI